MIKTEQFTEAKGEGFQEQWETGSSAKNQDWKVPKEIDSLEIHWWNKGLEDTKQTASLQQNT